MSERLTTYHCGKAVIKDKSLLSEAMEKLAEFEEKEKCGEWLDAIELAKTAIALQSQKWIPVSERLPKKHEDALTTTRYDGFLGRYGTWVETGFINDIGEWSGACTCIGGKVIAWMPLPKPYRREDEQDHETD